MNTKKKTIITASLITLLLLVIFHSLLLPPREISREALAAYYLKQELKADNTFKYEINLVSGKYSKDDNIVRQAGAGYGLAEYYLYSKDPLVKEALANAIRGYEAQSIPFKGGLLVSGNGKLSGAKLGASALAFLAEIQYAQASNDNTFKQLREKWLRGILALRIPKKGFRKLPKSELSSPYSDGEVWLALAMYHQFWPQNEEVAELLPQLDQYLIENYGKELNGSFFQWGIMAAVERYKKTASSELSDFISKQTRDYFNRYSRGASSNLVACGLVEALAAIDSVTEGNGDFDDAFKNQVRERIASEMESIRQYQILSDTVQFGRGWFTSDVLASHKGAFLSKKYQFRSRIDYTQHCLSAMVKKLKAEEAR